MVMRVHSLVGLEQETKDDRKRDRLLNTQSAILLIWPHACHHGGSGSALIIQPNNFLSPSVWVCRLISEQRKIP